MPTIETIKEQAQAQTPLVLFTFTFTDGTVKRYVPVGSGTGDLSYGGNTYQARVVRHNLFEIQAMSEQGIDQMPRLALELANADTQMSQLNAASGFKGAALVAMFVFADLIGASPSTDSWTAFNGVCDAPAQITDTELSVTAVNRLNMQRVVLPPVRIQRRCPWPFPATAAQRDLASQAQTANSIFFMCGYSPDVALAAGKYPSGKYQVGVTPFTTCAFTRAECVARGMFNTDAVTTLAAAASAGATTISVNADIVATGFAIIIGGVADATSGFRIQESRTVTAKSGVGPFTYTVSPALSNAHGLGDNVGRVTSRFGGVESKPATYPVRAFGASKFTDAAIQDPQYGDFAPLVWGTCWIDQPPVIALRNDGNLTRFEAVLSFGQISAVSQVVVNGTTIPAAVTGQNMTSSGWWQLTNDGGRLGAFDGYFIDTNGNPTLEPRGSLAYLAINVPTKLADGNSIPRVRVLLDGRKIETFDSGGNSLGFSFTNNPVWVLLDVLKLSRWKTADMDLVSFYNAAQVCATAINQKDNNGSTVSAARFRANVVVRQKRSAADVILGLRNNARLYFTYSQTGALQCNVEQTIAGQQPTKPYGSNATTTIAGGWPAYVYSDTTATILRRPDGASSLRRFYRPISDTPTRVGFEFQDEFNQYQQDSISVTKVDEQAAVGFDISAAIPVDGIPNYDQGARIAAFQLAKSVLGNDFVEFETSVKAAGQQVGQIIALTYAKESFTNRLYRTIKLAPKENYRSVTVTAQLHDDTWYADTYGQDIPPKRRSGGFEDVDRPPRPPAGGNTATPATTDNLIGPIADIREITTTFTETSITEADGTPMERLQTAAFGPPSALSKLTSPPLVNLQPTINTVGGTITGGVTLYYAVAARDSVDSKRSLPSWIITATVPSGTNTNQVQLTGLIFDAQASGRIIYRGRSPSTMVAIAEQTDVTSTYTDNGGTALLQPPADPLCDHINMRWRLALQLRLGPTLNNFTPVSTSYVGNTGLSLGVNSMVGATVEIVRGLGVGQKRKVASNTAQQITVDVAFGSVDGTSEFVIYNQTTSATATSISDSTLSLTADQYDNKVVRIVRGTGVYQERRISTHDAVGNFNITSPWDITPDTTSSFAVVDDSWSPAFASSPIGQAAAAQTFAPVLEVPNVTDQLIEIVTLAADSDDNESIYELSPMQRYAVAGTQQNPILLDATTGNKMKMRVENGVVTWTKI